MQCIPTLTGGCKGRDNPANRPWPLPNFSIEKLIMKKEQWSDDVAYVRNSPVVLLARQE